ncbi:MMPL family transporter [Nocardia goodfellowii]|uniref:RND superfamily putative drug exporter n=1 Tax=Nocardia goodfellowii TaxID=882446 RepID=A0ABS4QDT8_9NOCA|nr:MMPL family transporter [Nocardia goodfellowii]MBP2189837.1 RND superfamily putative drug exporter [Nocardia goodfellowii]
MPAPTDPDMTDPLGTLARIPCGRRAKWVVLGVWIIALLALAPFAGKLTGAQQNDSVTWLPDSAESTQAFELAETFGNSEHVPVVLVYERTSGITEADRAAIAADAARFEQVEHIVADKVIGPIQSRDGQAVELLAPIDMGTEGWSRLTPVVEEIKAAAGERPAGLSFHATGPAGYGAEFGAAFEGIDGLLLYSAAAVVVVILLLTYGPMLWVLPLLAAGFALAVAQAAVFGATELGLVMNAQSQGILTVLVFGAGTDYALLLIARYREELRRHEDRHEAMAVALRRAGPAVLASGSTVIVAMLALLVAEMNSTRGIGPVCAIGVTVALLAMLTLLPALLVIAGRWIFWPRHPRYGTRDHTESGLWARVGQFIAGRPRIVWIGTALALGALATGAIGLEANGIANKDSFVGASDAVDGTEVLERHFEAGTGNPVVVIGQAARAEAITAALKSTPGITTTTEPVRKDGLLYLEATLADPPDSPAADATVDRVREAVHAADADAEVGGQTATVLDIKRAVAQDNRAIGPLVLVIVMAILMLLLRSLLAPILLTATVVLSYFAALGLSRWIWELLGFRGADAGLPLIAFVFLVALGIDYNIFLMSRVHEEAGKHRTRAGALIGLSATGGVITSAGLVLAGTFAVFTTLPVVTFAEMGILIAVGVLLDTVIVRSILVTALTLDIGDKIWWPSALSRPRAEESAEREVSLST